MYIIGDFIIFSMKTISIFSILFIASINFSSSKGSEVYLCNSPNGKKYHYTKNCKGLSNCRHEIIKVSLKKALEMNKGLCGWEK